jgi:uncharacterized OB-fold protein
LTADRLLPEPTALSAPFWSAAARGELILQQCTVCGNLQWTPQRACRTCLSLDLGWTKVSGQGVLYSYSVVTRPQSPAFTAPYIVAIVQLDEGPRMLTDLVGVDPAAVSIGMAVQVSFETVGNIGLYHFTPVQGARGDKQG